jgi:hypothetical protein
MEDSKTIEYDDRTKQLMDLRGEAERQFDRQIVYLSSGGLVFSVGFVKDIIGDNSEPVYKWLLIIVWISFAISLVINLISYVTSRMSIDSELHGKEKLSDKFNSCTVWMNWISVIALLNGLLFLLLFASANF